MELRNFVAVSLVVAGILALTGALILFPHAGVNSYGLSVSDYTSESVPEEATQYEFAEMSPEGQSAFQRAYRSPDGNVVLYGEENLPEEFTFGHYVPLFVVSYEGDLYEVRSYSHSPVRVLFRTVAFWTLVGGGLIAILVACGIVLYARGRRQSADNEQ